MKRIPIAALALALIAPGVHARTPASAPTSAPTSAPAGAAERSRALHARGLELYRLGRYDEAVAKFEAGYKLSGLAGFLYNIALAHRKKGDCEAALRHYRQYLERKPEAYNRGLVERRIEEMRRCVERKKSTAKGRDERPPPVEEKRSPRWIPWVIGGVGLAAAATGSVLYLTVGDDFRRLESECAPRCEPGRWERLRLQERVGIGLIVAGGVTAVVGAAWAVLRERRADRGSGDRVSLLVGPRAVSVRGVF